MPKLPDYTALGERPAPQPASGIATYEPGNARMVGMAGQEIADAGREVGQAADIVQASNLRQDEIVAQAAGNTLQQVGITAEFDPNKGFRNVKGGNAVGQPFLDSYTSQFSEAQKSIRDSLQNDNQRRIFDQHANVAGLQFQSALLQHQARETDTFNDNTANDSIDLALRKMAQNPTNELNFQTGLAQINGTIDATAQRKGLPPEVAQVLKNKALDSAYTTRITSVLQGIPGAVAANPYVAEKMFEQVRDQMGPQAQVHLAEQVQKGVQGVQARDTAQAFIFGPGATKPQDIAPAVTGAPLSDPQALEKVVLSNESGGQRYDAQGNLLTSPKGAQGEMQVMPATARAPGFGVTPARDDSPEELARVGRDYLGAMSARYNDPALTLAAYNAGPGQVDKWIAKFGDPRSGAISPAEWAAKIPLTETRDYVAKGLQKLATSVGDTAPVQPPTANQLKLDLYSRVQTARKVAEQQYPGDTAYADNVAARVEGYGRQVISDQIAREAGARDTLMSGVLGHQQDGSDKPTSLDGLLSDPQMKQAWDQATPETKAALQQRYAKGEKGFDSESFASYYALKGAAVNNPGFFADMDLGKYFGAMPDSALHELVQQQASINKKDIAAQDRDLNWNKARGTVEDMLKPLNMGRTVKAGTVQSKQTEIFYGQLQDAMQAYKDQNGKWPDTTTTRQFAAGLLTDGKQSGGLLWDTATKAYQALSDPTQAGKFYVPLPSGPQLQTIQQQFTRAMGRAPSQAELQTYWTKYKLSGGK